MLSPNGGWYLHQYKYKYRCLFKYTFLFHFLHLYPNQINSIALHEPYAASILNFHRDNYITWLMKYKKWENHLVWEDWQVTKLEPGPRRNYRVRWLWQKRQAKTEKAGATHHLISPLVIILCLYNVRSITKVAYILPSATRSVVIILW